MRFQVSAQSPFQIVTEGVRVFIGTEGGSAVQKLPGMKVCDDGSSEEDVVIELPGEDVEDVMTGFDGIAELIPIGPNRAIFFPQTDLVLRPTS